MCCGWVVVCGGVGLEVGCVGGVTKFDPNACWFAYSLHVSDLIDLQKPSE